jgi:cytochrome c peroxidase
MTGLAAFVGGLVFAVAFTATGCRDDGGGRQGVQGEPFTEEELETISTLSPMPPVPEEPTNAVSDSDAAAHFGRFLFFDERLSKNGEVSCASCHRPSHGFSVPTKQGHGQGATPRHPPTLLNAAYHRWYDWDGKADTLWAQAARPLENPGEHGFTRTRVARLVARQPDLRRAYESVFDELPELSSDERFPQEARPTPGRPDSTPQRAWEAMRSEDRETVNRVFTNVTKAIAAYERRLVSKNAPFDRYVEGLESGDEEKLEAISPAAKRGLKLFVGEAECVNCHNGPAFTDQAFHNLGLGARPWLPRRDEGRWEGVRAVKNTELNAAGPMSDAREGEAADWLKYLKRTPEDHGQFKTPSLRNVERTAPYMHGGHFQTLEEVVRFYSTLNEQPTVGHREEMLEPLGLSDREVANLVAFLRSLTGESLPPRLLGPPESPVPDGN